MNYHRKHTEFLQKAGAVLSDLPKELIILISKFEEALNQWSVADKAEQLNYLPVLEKTDAYISFCIYKQFKEKVDQAEDEKARRLAQMAEELNFNDED
ncbi:MAG: hypothetical protein ACXVP0_06425 [Bacteroidia bacterium]